MIRRSRQPIGLVLALSALLTSTILTGSACVQRVPATASPEAKRAGTAIEVITRLGELQSLVIDLQGKGRVGLNDARTIVAAISGDTHATPPAVGLVEVLQTVPAGWQQTARNGWNALVPYLNRNSDLAGYVPIIDALMAGW